MRSSAQGRPKLCKQVFAAVPRRLGCCEEAGGTGQAEGRKAPEQITLFDSVGFATEDFSALRYIRDQHQATGLYVELDLLADSNEPRDLFGMLLRAALRPAV